MKRSNRSFRIYLANQPTGDQLVLDAEQAHYLANVLRMRAGDQVIAFNGNGAELLTEVAGLTRRAGLLRIIDTREPLPESPLKITLIQAIVKSEAMDLIVQKATELGVSRIIPAITDFSVVRIDPERSKKKLAHWQKIARSACEQSGRHYLPEIDTPTSLEASLKSLDPQLLTIALDPRAPQSDVDFREITPTAVACIVGPEGGFSENDESYLVEAKVRRINLGLRTLRADTAAISICAIVQQQLGDLGSR